MSINNKTIATVQALVSATDTTEGDFRTGMDDIMTQVNTNQGFARFQPQTELITSISTVTKVGAGDVIVIGAGGGGGSSGTSNDYGGGKGGNSGWRVLFPNVPDGTTISVTSIGAVGANATSWSVTGSPGGSTGVTIGSSTATFGGGAGGPAQSYYGTGAYGGISVTGSAVILNKESIGDSGSNAISVTQPHGYGQGAMAGPHGNDPNGSSKQAKAGSAGAVLIIGA